ncbi:lipocalin-like domain-containing protein [Archangium violaceum]|uniref:lipocalin-like domain-containing protein n=1 Tax=Archangium violaceum TaxID=83451 RepID=UPI002B29B823|nr:lipocalin-like domain-containing protein [Archangium gephyra]
MPPRRTFSVPGPRHHHGLLPRGATHEAGPPPFKSADLKGGLAQEAKDALDGAAVYFGTYETEEQTDTVCHHITGSVFPNWIGTVQRRKATVKGNRLVLSTEPLLMGGSESVVVLEWQRMGR